MRIMVCNTYIFTFFLNFSRILRKNNTFNFYFSNFLDTVIAINITIVEIGVDDFEAYKDDLTAVVASSVNVSMGDVTLSIIPPEHAQQWATIMAKVKTGKENHDEVLKKMSAQFYNSNLYTRIKTNAVLKDVVQTTPTVGEPVVVNIPRKFVMPLIICA